MSKVVIAAAIALTLCGCVAVWGRAYNIESANSDSVVIKYDGHFTSPGAVQNVAQARCAQRGRNAVSQGESTSIWGLTTVSFTCTERRG